MKETNIENNLLILLEQLTTALEQGDKASAKKIAKLCHIVARRLPNNTGTNLQK